MLKMQKFKEVFLLRVNSNDVQLTVNVNIQYELVVSMEIQEIKKKKVLLQQSSSSRTACKDFQNSLSLFIGCYHQSLPAGLPDYILYPHRPDVDKFLLVCQHLHVHVKGSIQKDHLCVRSCFSNSVHMSFFVFVKLGWFCDRG